MAKSDMVVTLMRGVVNSSGYADQLQMLEPPIELTPIPFVMSWHRRNDVHPVQRWLRECIASLLQ